MKKLTTLALAGAMAVASFASASATRWTGFGQASLFIADVQDTFTLPQTAASNPDALYLEFGPQYHYDAYNNEFNSNAPGTQADNSVDGSAWGGANLKLGAGVLSIWGNRPRGWSSSSYSGDFSGPSNLQWYYINHWPYWSFPDQVPTGSDAGTSYLAPLNTIDIIYAWELSDKATLGLGVNRAGAHYYNNDARLGSPVDNWEQSSVDWGVTAGIDIKDLGPIAALQIGIQANAGGAENTWDNSNVTNNNNLVWTTQNLRIGADVNGSKGKFQRIELGASNQNGVAKTNPGGGTAANTYVESDASALGYDLGWAMGMSSAKGMGLSGLIFTGLNTVTKDPFFWGNSVSKSEYDTNTYNLNFVTAGEGKLNSWLTGRAGFSTTIFGTTDASRDYLYSTANGSNRAWGNNLYSTVITLGLSIAVGDITIDGALNQDLLYNGPYFTNGIATPLFSQVSATWAWGAKE